MASIYRLPVSLMSPEHAERKRAQDRVNQRYSRARRKSKVEELEQTNKNLLQRLADAEAEIARLRDQASAVRKALGDDVAIHSAAGNKELDAQAGRIRQRSEESNEELLPLTHTSTSSPWIPSPSASTAAFQSRQLMQNNAISSTSLCPMQQFSNNYLLDTPFDFGDNSTFSLLASSSFTEFTGRSPAQISHLNTTYDVVPQLSPYVPPHMPIVTESVPQWQALPLHLPATTLLDQVVLKTTEKGRQWKMLHAGRQHSELMQPSFPSISSLLNPHSEDDAENPIATAVSAQVRRTNVSSFAARVAFHYIVSMVLRWYVSPCEETFRQLPENMRPTELQRTVPHAPWIDLFVWPEGRDAIIKQMDQGDFDDFRLLTSSTLSIHWPYSDADVFLSSSDGKQTILNPVFISHIRNCRNWTVGQIVADTFPFMKGVPTKQGQSFASSV